MEFYWYWRDLSTSLWPFEAHHSFLGLLRKGGTRRVGQTESESVTAHNKHDFCSFPKGFSSGRVWQRRVGQGQNLKRRVGRLVCPTLKEYRSSSCARYFHFESKWKSCRISRIRNFGFETRTYSLKFIWIILGRFPQNQLPRIPGSLTSGGSNGEWHGHGWPLVIGCACLPFDWIR